jgi:hypothetical protein
MRTHILTGWASFWGRCDAPVVGGAERSSRACQVRGGRGPLLGQVRRTSCLLAVCRARARSGAEPVAPVPHARHFMGGMGRVLADQMACLPRGGMAPGPGSNRLITQRSQVQILPPLRENAGRRPLLSQEGPLALPPVTRSVTGLSPIRASERETPGTETTVQGGARVLRLRSPRFGFSECSGDDKSIMEARRG